MRLLIAFLVSATAACIAMENNTPNQWAVLIAGSNGWENYRHQADVAHAYQILIRRGIPASQIIVLSYDDVANSPENPNKGKLINRPNGPDVNKGVKIDYKGDDITPQLFLDVLAGDKKAVKGKGTGRVLESGENDIVFVNFADHGGPGILGFPNDILNAKDLINTLNKLTKDKKYAKLVLYIEACEAGSNFDALIPQNTRILVSTASAPDESSWGCYCDTGSLPCLGDLYSVNWMEHVDKKLPANENLFDQYQTIRTKTDKSHVQLYGDYRVGPSESQDFLGRNNVVGNHDEDYESIEKSAVPSRDIALYYYKRMAKVGESKSQRSKYARLAHELEEKREMVDNTFHRIISKVGSNDEDMISAVNTIRHPLTKDVMDSYIRVYSHFGKKCFNISKNQYVLKHFYKFVNLCYMGYEDEVIEAINVACDDEFPIILNTH